MDYKRIVGDNVRGYRKKAGLTQIQLGVRSEVNSEHLSRLESGLENATIETLEKLGKELGVTLDKFFVEESYKQ